MQVVQGLQELQAAKTARRARPPARTPLRAHTPCAQTHERIYEQSKQLSFPMMYPSLTATARPVHSHTPANAYDPAKRVMAGHHPIRSRTSTVAKTRASSTTTTISPVEYKSLKSLTEEVVARTFRFDLRYFLTISTDGVSVQLISSTAHLGTSCASQT